MICAFIACGRPEGEPHTDGCPYRKTFPSQRVSTTLNADLWAGLDRWAEARGMTVTAALREAVQRLVDADHDDITGLGQQLLIHPLLLAKPPEEKPSTEVATSP